MKKYLSLLLSLALLVTLALPGYAADDPSLPGFKYEAAGDGIAITQYTGDETTLKVPSRIGGEDVVEIGESAFAGNVTLKSVSIPSTVEKIDDYAFESCSSLKTVKLTNGLKSIGYGAFSGCAKLTNLTLPAGLETIEKGAFYYCMSLRELTVPSSVSEIGEFAFSSTGISSLTIPEDTALTEIKGRVFYCCNLREVTLPKAIKAVGTRAFYGNQCLSSIDMPGVESIGESAFDGIDESEPSVAITAKVVKANAFTLALDLEEGVETLENGAIGGSIEVMKIPASLTNIEPGALKRVSTKKYEVAEDNPAYKSVDGVLYTKDGSTLVAYPCESTRDEYTIEDGTKTIAGYAFATVMNLTYLNIPDSVKEIEDNGFTTIISEKMDLTIPETVETIGNQAFVEARLHSLTIKAQIPAITEKMFRDASINKIKVPESVTSIEKLAFYGSTCSFKIPASVTETGEAAFLNANGKFTSEEGGYLEVDENLLYANDKKTLVSFLNQGEDSSPESLTVANGVTEICDYAIAGDSDLTEIHLPKTVAKLGTGSVGYEDLTPDKYNYGMKKPNTKLVIYSSSEAVREYARTNSIACFKGTPSANLTKVTLKGGESSTFAIDNANVEDVSFTSDDQNIATVDQDGVITGQRKGTATVVASIGHKYYRCKVTVTSDSDNPAVSDFDESEYTTVTKGNSLAWMNDYVSLNEGRLTEGSDANIFTSMYKNDFPTYYEAIWSVQTDSEKYKVPCRSEMGDDYEESAKLMAHGLQTELKRYKMNTDTVLFSGTDDLDLITGTDYSISSLKDLVGTTLTLDETTSTTTDESVPIGFGDYVWIIYADKEAVDGGYIEYTVGQGDGGEYEVLMNPGLQVTVLDAGVRYKKITPLAEGSSFNHYERYVKVALTAGKDTKELCSYNISVDNTKVTYAGKACTPSVTVKAGDKVLTKNTDYTLTYSNNTKAGKGKVTIKGKGRYTGTVTKYFTILPSKAVISKTAAAKKSVKITMKKKVSALGGTGYQVKYRLKGSASWKTAKTSGQTLTIKNLKSGKRYQIKVRAYRTVSGKTYYGTWSAVKTTAAVK